MSKIFQSADDPKLTVPEVSEFVAESVRDKFVINGTLVAAGGVTADQRAVILDMSDGTRFKLTITRED